MSLWSYHRSLNAADFSDVSMISFVLCGNWSHKSCSVGEREGNTVLVSCIFGSPVPLALSTLLACLLCNAANSFRRVSSLMTSASCTFGTRVLSTVVALMALFCCEAANSFCWVSALMSRRTCVRKSCPYRCRMSAQNTLYSSLYLSSQTVLYSSCTPVWRLSLSLSSKGPL